MFNKRNEGSSNRKILEGKNTSKMNPFPCNSQEFLTELEQPVLPEYPDSTPTSLPAANITYSIHLYLVINKAVVTPLISPKFHKTGFLEIPNDPSSHELLRIQ